MFGNNGQELGTKDRTASLNKTDYKEITVQPVSYTHLAMVKELREMTGAGMMDCKKALTATEGDMDLSLIHISGHGVNGNH